METSASMVVREFENLKITYSEGKFYGCAEFAGTLVALTKGYKSVLPLFKEIEIITDLLIALDIITKPIINNESEVVEG